MPWQRPVEGDEAAPIVIICDAQDEEACLWRRPLSDEHAAWLMTRMMSAGLDPRLCRVVSLCPPIHEDDRDSAARQWAHVQRHLNGLQELTDGARVVVTFGALATRAMLGRQCAITKVRGVPIEREDRPPLLPTVSPGFVRKLPEHESTFQADLRTLARLASAGFQLEDVERPPCSYEWRSDISDLLGARPRVVAIDTEGTGLRWWSPEVEVITVQLSWQPGSAVVCPIHEEYWRRWLVDILGPPDELLPNLRRQVVEFCADPAIRKIGQNIKYDHHMLRQAGIELNGWLHDTMLLAFAIDENAMSLGLDDLVRRFVPEMAGYSDELNVRYDKSLMMEVPPEDMLPYAGGDPDATLRVARKLLRLLKDDERQRRVYRKIQMPANECFARATEPYGLQMDRDRLRSLCGEVDDWLDEQYRRLIRLTPHVVRRRHWRAGKELKFSRPDFVRDVLYSPEGFNVTPVMWTKSTQNLPPAQRVPSTSAKEHMPYHVNDNRPLSNWGLTDDVARPLEGPGRQVEVVEMIEQQAIETVGDFVAALREYQLTAKLKSTYYGDEEAGTGFWQYMDENGVIYPSFGTTVTNTGRTNSRDPNAQNFPKRGSRFAKLFGSTFVARPGWVFVAADLSQIELRIAAWMAQEPTMLQIFRDGGDIHAATAAAIMGLSQQEFEQLPREERDLARFRAKACNFGFIYGMWWRRYMMYAKVEYGLDVTEEDAQAFRETFFRLYWGLEAWHEYMKRFAHDHGYVRALHGAVRHLPSINSSDPAIARQAERYAVNSPVQRFGSDLGLIAYIRMSHQLDHRVARTVDFIHDQVIMEVREDHAPEVAAALKWCMQTPPLQEWFGIEPPVPILSDLKAGWDLGSLKEIKGALAVKPDWWDNDEKAAARRFNSGIIREAA